MSPRTEGQFVEIRQEKRKLIRETALKLFAVNGFYNTSINDIAKNAGISKGLIYNYYTSKEELLYEIISMGINEFMENFDPNKDGVLSKDEMRFLISKTFDLMEDKPGFWRLYFALAVQPTVSEILKKIYQEKMMPFFTVARDYFVRQNSKIPEIDVLILHALIDGICMNYLNAPEIFPIKNLKVKIFEMYNL